MGRLRSKPLISVLKAIEKFVYRKADRIFVVSDSMKQNIIDKGVRSEKLAVIPNWVDAEFITPVERMNPFRIDQGLEDLFLVLFAGNVGYAAGLRNVLEAAKRVASNPRVFFLIVGEGSAKRGLRAYADELGLQNVRFLTTQPRELLPQLLGSADLSLVTLRTGMGSLSVPSKSYAIMASARPILAAVPEDSAVRDLIHRGDCGLWVQPDDPESIAQAILSVVDQPDRLEAMGQRGRVLAEKEFARPIGTTRYRELLRDLAERRSHLG
jgi:colanic acid biosynthesis glycosyl transferase WcaI